MGGGGGGENLNLSVRSPHCVEEKRNSDKNSNKNSQVESFANVEVHDYGIVIYHFEARITGLAQTRLTLTSLCEI